MTNSTVHQRPGWRQLVSAPFHVANSFYNWVKVCFILCGISIVSCHIIHSIQSNHRSPDLTHKKLSTLVLHFNTKISTRENFRISRGLFKTKILQEFRKLCTFWLNRFSGCINPIICQFKVLNLNIWDSCLTTAPVSSSDGETEIWSNMWITLVIIDW